MYSMPSFWAAAAIVVTGMPTTPNIASTPWVFRARAMMVLPSISAMRHSSCGLGARVIARVGGNSNGLPKAVSARRQAFRNSGSVTSSEIATKSTMTGIPITIASWATSTRFVVTRGPSSSCTRTVAYGRWSL